MQLFTPNYWWLLQMQKMIYLLCVPATTDQDSRHKSCCYLSCSFLRPKIDELWIELGAGKKNRWLPIHVDAQHLNKLKCLALLLWYAFTGCDTVSTVSMVAGKNYLECMGNISWTDLFARISLSSADIADEDLTFIERDLLFCSSTKLTQLPLLMVHATSFSRQLPWNLFYKAVAGAKLGTYSNF